MADRMGERSRGLRGESVAALRRRARVLALQALYELDVTSHSAEQVIAHRVEEEPEFTAEGRQFVRHLVQGIREHQATIDSLIHQVAPAWPLAQMSSVDKSVLRLAIFELLFDESVPDRVAINEAVELAKIFGHDTSAKFVNGVLGTVAEMIESQRGESGSQSEGERV